MFANFAEEKAIVIAPMHIGVPKMNAKDIIPARRLKKSFRKTDLIKKAYTTGMPNAGKMFLKNFNKTF